MAHNKLLAGVAESASYNIFLQIFFRVQTFLLNGFILRYIEKDVLGIINVRLTLLYSTLTFLNTEAFKNATIANPEKQNWRQVVNLLWLTVPTSIVSSACLGYIWLFVLEQPNPSLMDQYTLAVFTVGASCVIERFAEPIYVVTQIYFFNKLKALLQCITIASQCIIFAVFVYSKPESSILGFCFGQVTRSLLWVLILYGYFIFYFRTSTLDYFKNIRDFLPCFSLKYKFFSSDQLSLTFSFFKQGILKQLLTEGERYMMTVFNILNFADQGVYDVVSNLGSLAARFIFRPIEESVYQYFAQCIQREVPLSRHEKSDVGTASRVLEHTLKIMVLISLVILTFGFSYSRLLLHLYGGEILSSGVGPSLLRWHCVYIFFIAINGVTEAYAFATMSKNEINRFNYIMVFISLAFLVVSWGLTPILGGVGLILANCANMTMRIVHSIYIIFQSFLDTSYKPLRGLFPHFAVVGLCFITFLVTALSEHYFCCEHLVSIMVHVGIGCIFLALTTATTYFAEKELFSFILQLWRKRQSNMEEKIS